MGEAPENGRESSHSARANGVNGLFLLFSHYVWGAEESDFSAAVIKNVYLIDCVIDTYV